MTTAKYPLCISALQTIHIYLALWIECVQRDLLYTGRLESLNLSGNTFCPAPCPIKNSFLEVTQTQYWGLLVSKSSFQEVCIQIRHNSGFTYFCKYPRICINDIRCYRCISCRFYLHLSAGEHCMQMFIVQSLWDVPRDVGFALILNGSGK